MRSADTETTLPAEGKIAVPSIPIWERIRAIGRRPWGKLRVQHLVEKQTVQISGVFILPYLMLWMALFVESILLLARNNDAEPTSLWILLPILGLTVMGLVALSLLFLALHSRVAAHARGWLTGLSTVQDRRDSLSRFLLLNRGFEAAVRVENVWIAMIRPATRAVRAEVFSSACVRMWCTLRQVFFDHEWSTIVEAPIAGRAAWAFGTSRGQWGGAVTKLPADEQTWLIEQLAALSAPQGVAHLGLREGRLRIAVHGKPYTRALADALAQAVIRARGLLNVEHAVPDDYRSAGTQPTATEAALINRPFITDREGDSLYWTFHFENAAWNAEDAMFAISSQHARREKVL